MSPIGPGRVPTRHCTPYSNSFAFRAKRTVAGPAGKAHPLHRATLIRRTSAKDATSLGGHPMRLSRTRAVTAVVTIAAIWSGASLAVSDARAQTPAPAAQPTAASNELQRSVEVYSYNMAAKSGALRGEVIYYYKCWNCHNDYTRAAGSPAPTLKDIFKRANLITGDPVSDETVAKQIRNGSAPDARL